MSAVLFDIGSTLVQGPDISPSKLIARLLGMDDSQKGRVADIIMCSVFKDPLHMCSALKKAFPHCDFSEEKIKKIWLDQEIAPEEIPGATEAVRRVKNAGFKVGLVSDIWAPYFKGFVSACPQLASLVDFAGLSFQEGCRKPSSTLFKKALSVLGANPGSTWMVGDTYQNDLAPAMKLGMRTVWVLNRPEKECRAMEGVLKGSLPRPDIIIDSIADLCGIDLGCKQ